MSTSTPSSGTSLGRRALALVVLLIAGFVLFKIVLGFLAGIGTLLLIVFAVVALVWAIRIL